MEDFGLWEAIVSIFWFTMLLAWITMLIAILGDIFRDRELKGSHKALWAGFIVLIPWLGALCYIFVRGNSMNERSLHARAEQEATFRTFVQDAAGTGNTVAAELKDLAALRDNGVLSPAEYEQAKTKVLS